MGKVVASLKSKPWWVLWIWVCPWLILAPKVFKFALTNLLFGLCRSMWVIEHLSFFLVPSRSSNTPFYPQSVASQGACTNSLFFCCFQFLFTFESIKEPRSTSTPPMMLSQTKISICTSNTNVNKLAFHSWSFFTLPYNSIIILATRPTIENI
jgi:hypothetical protein